ncbi:helix-turn-helix domain-containing protein [Rahnella sp. BIGb0236]|uniref:helix-turn-helix domain-containing protein n=1 Tax=Rahnella sp. BIGb0236 TaxID=2485117 RepID=UPI00105D3B0C
MAVSKDWHTADINALARPWPKGEMIIAKTIGIEAKEIWPSRYFDGKTGTKINRNLRGK